MLRSQTASLSNLSRISQLNMPGFSRLYSSIFFSTSGVVTCFKRTGRQVLLPRPLGPAGGAFLRPLGRSPLLAEGAQLSKAVYCEAGPARKSPHPKATWVPSSSPAKLGQSG